MNGVTGVFTQGAFKGLTGIQAFGQSISHGLVGGLSTKLSGGSFSKGALISFLNKGASRAVSSVNLFVSTVKHAIFGGAISKYIAGGSFSAGARLAAMATFFNEGGGNVYKFVKDAGKFFSSVAGAVNVKLGPGAGYYVDVKHKGDFSVRAGVKVGGGVSYEDGEFDVFGEAKFGVGGSLGSYGGGFDFVDVKVGSSPEDFNIGIFEFSPPSLDTTTSVKLTVYPVTFHGSIDWDKVHWPWN